MGEAWPSISLDGGWSGRSEFGILYAHYHLIASAQPTFSFAPEHARSLTPRSTPRCCRKVDHFRSLNQYSATFSHNPAKTDDSLSWRESSTSVIKATKMTETYGTSNFEIFLSFCPTFWLRSCSFSYIAYYPSFNITPVIRFVFRLPWEKGVFERSNSSFVFWCTVGWMFKLSFSLDRPPVSHKLPLTNARTCMGYSLFTYSGLDRCFRLSVQMPENTRHRGKAGLETMRVLCGYAGYGRGRLAWALRISGPTPESGT
jgi:hypothetical protein